MDLIDYITGNTDAVQAEFMRKKRLERQQREEQAARQAEAERQANVDAMQQAAMQYAQQQQGIRHGYEQDAARGLNQLGLLRLIGDFNTGGDAATQGLSQGMSTLSGDTAAAAQQALAPTMLPRPPQLQQQQQQQQQLPNVVGSQSMKPQTLYDSLVSQADGTIDTISAKSKEAKERAKALLRAIRNAR